MTTTLTRRPRSRAIREPHLSAAAIGKRLREAREQAGLTQRQLCDGTSYTGAYVSRLEAGDRLASVSCLRALSAKLAVSVVWLEQGENPELVDLTLSRAEAFKLLDILDEDYLAGSDFELRLAYQIRTGLGLPNPPPRPAAIQRLLAGEQLPARRQRSLPA